MRVDEESEGERVESDKKGVDGEIEKDKGKIHG